MTEHPPVDSARRAELTEAAYDYVLEHGLVDVSLRPLAAAIGSSPRVLLYLFGSKDGLVRALLARARTVELAALARTGTGADDLRTVAEGTWRWLSVPANRPPNVLWLEAYARSLVEPDGPWAEFARTTVGDWLDLLAAAQPPRERRTRAGAAQRTAVLAILRGGLADLLATGDERRVTAGVRTALARLC